MIALVVVILLTFHLLSMNVSSGGPLLCAWLEWRGSRAEDGQSTKLAQAMALWSILLLLVGTAIGVVLVLVSMATGDRHLVDVLPLFRHKVGWGVLELICSFVWMGGYWAWLAWARPRTWATCTLHRLVAIASATNLLYHFPPLLTVMARAARGEIRVDGPVTPDIFRTLAFSSNVMAHAVHFALASLAVSALFLTWLARRAAQPRQFFVVGARFALVATVLQIPIGIWLLISTSAAAQSRLLGGSAGGTGCFVASMLCAFYLLQTLAMVAVGEATEKLVRRSHWLLLLTVTLMVGTLHFARG